MHINITCLIDWQTFSQLCVFNYDTKNVEVRNAPWHIQDEPRFAFRGLLLGKNVA
jgi:hexosaminidase